MRVRELYESCVLQVESGGVDKHVDSIFDALGAQDIDVLMCSFKTSGAGLSTSIEPQFIREPN